MSVNAIYQHYSDNVAPLATITGSAEDSTYPPSYLANLNPAKPAKLTTTTGWFKFNFGADQRIDILGIIHHNLDEGLEVRLQGNATDSWVSPTVNELVPVPAYREDGYPLNLFLDVTLATNYSTGGLPWWRVLFVTANGEHIAIGEIWLGQTKRTLSPNISWGAVLTEERKIVEKSTDFGVTNIYDLGVTVRKVKGDLDSDDAQASAFWSWVRDARFRVRAFLVLINPETDDPMLVRFLKPTQEVAQVVTDRNTIQIELLELGRGLVL